MPRNIEIKARLQDRAAIEAKVHSMQSEKVVVLVQDDTFFHCPNGRLKLREFDDGSSELIFYQRQDTAGPKESFYVSTPISAATELRETLTLAWGIAGRVQKIRHLYLLGRTRVHLDCVTGLGDFLELEVVLQDEEENQVGVDEAHAILRELGVPQSQLLKTAYVDLLNAET